MNSLTASLGSSSVSNGSSAAATQDLVIVLKSHHVLRFYFNSNDNDLTLFITALLQCYVADTCAVLSRNLSLLCRNFPSNTSSSSSSWLWKYDRQLCAKVQFDRWKCPTSDWRISGVNQDFGWHPSLPEFFIVPTPVHDRILLEASSFRSEKRVPILAYYHSDQRVRK